MGVAVLEKQYTPEDLLTLRDGPRYELVDGQLVEKFMGAKSARIAQVVNRHIDIYAEAHKLGLVFPPDCGYQIFPDSPGRVRKPDGSFVRFGRLHGDKPPDGLMRIPPDLALEVVSPNDLAEHVEIRVNELLEAGVRLVWVVYPNARVVNVFRKDGTSSKLTSKDELTGEDVLPGFVCRVADLLVGV